MLRKLLVLSALLISTKALAVGDAGCGLGSLIFKENAKLSQTLALTTNGLTWTQFFGITTGTSNCSASKWVKADHEARYYAQANMPNLKVDMARGEGESLTAFAQILGCKESGIPAFGQLVQSRYSQIFPADSVTPDQLVMSVKLEVSRDSNVATACAQNI